MFNFGDVLKELRKKNNIPVDKLSKIFNVSKSSYYNWENGYRTPSNDMLRKIADFYNVSLDYLISYDNLSQDEYFYIQVTEDNMKNIGITPGSRVLIKKQHTLDNAGDIMAVLINEKIKLMRIFPQEIGWILASENTNYPPTYTNTPPRIIGKAIKIEILL
jgi:transcriptional regulator with XRE-family HTH domain